MQESRKFSFAQRMHWFSALVRPTLLIANHLRRIHNGHGIHNKIHSRHRLLFFGISERGATVDEFERDHLAELSKAGICPNCAKAIGKGESVVRGPGVFCSLKCVAEYHQAEFSERDG